MAVVDVMAVAMEDDGAEAGLTLITPDTSYTMAGLAHAVQEVAQRLRAEGGEPGRIVPVVVEPDEEGILELLALWHLGATPMPLNSRLTGRERQAAMDALGGAPNHGAQVVLWTSGTSGSPRGVALSFEALAASSHAVSKRVDAWPRNTWLASLSPAHVGGLALLVRAILTEGRIVAYGPLTASRMSEVLQGTDALPWGVSPPVSHVSLVPTQLHRILDHRGDEPAPETLECVLLGGAHVPPKLLDRALALGWPVSLTYGMTEMCSQVATAPPSVVRKKPGTVGKPLDGVTVKVADDGEILTRGPTMALGYLRPSEGEAPVLEPVAEAGGWYHTGDLGHQDESGDLWITGRRSDRIISGGVNVDATEVEDVLRGHPAVMDACVVGAPDEEWGEVVVAWVVPVEGEFDLDGVEAWLGERLSAAKRPRRWVVEDAVPLNANGKPDRALVRKLVAG
jgi:O-succinylbenzoic acid--CoA ligase